MELHIQHQQHRLESGVQVVLPKRFELSKTTFRNIAIAATLVVSFLLLDWDARNIEMAHLMNAVERSETVMSDYNASQIAAQANLAASGATTDAASTGGLGSSNTPSQLVATHDLVKHVTVLPWHFGIKSAQSAYLKHNEAWQATLLRESLGNSSDTSQLTRTFKTAGTDFRHNVPPYAIFNLRSRVDELFSTLTVPGGAALPTAATGPLK